MALRTVTPGMALRLGLASPLGLAGTLVLVFSQIFGWVFVARSGLGELLEDPAEVVRTTGTIVAVEATAMRVNSRRIYAVTFEHGPSDAPLRATSYAAGGGNARAGETAAVEYPAGHPERARIVGMGRAPFPPWAGAIALAPLLVAAVLFAVAFGLTRRRVRLLRTGVLVTGRRTGQVKTVARVNRQPVYRLTYEATGPDGQPRTAVQRTHRIQDLGDSERVLCDPDGQGALLVALLPGRLRLLPDDTIAFDRAVLPTLVMGLVAVGVAGWVAVLVTSF